MSSMILNHDIPVRRFFACLAIGVLFVSMLSCQSSETASGDAKTPRGILLITVQSLRPAAVEGLSPTEEGASGLVRIQERAIRYTNAYTPVPIVRPAIASLFTGFTPDVHGVHSDRFDRLDTKFETLAERMSSTGRTTLGVSASQTTSYIAGFERGFDDFDGPESLLVGQAAFLPKPVEPQHIAEVFHAWHTALPESESWFAWLDFADLQSAPFTMPQEDPLTPYEEALSKVDLGIARIMETLEQNGDQPLIVLTSTSGMKIEPEGSIGSVYWLDEDTLRIPLWIVDPEQEPSVVDRFVNLADLHEMLLGYAGLAGGDSESVRYAWTWAPDDDFAWPNLTAWRGENGWVSLDQDQLDGIADRGEVADDDLKMLLKRPAMKREWQIRSASIERLKALDIELGEETYRPRPESSVRDELALYVQRYRFAFQSGRSRMMARTSRRLIEQDPDGFGPLFARGFLSISNGNLENGTLHVENLQKLYPRRPDTLHWSAHLALMNGDLDRASAWLEATVDLLGDDADVRYDQACLYSLLGEHGTAAEMLDRAIAAGFRNWKWIERDEDLSTLRETSQYAELMQKYGR